MDRDRFQRAWREVKTGADNGFIFSDVRRVYKTESRYFLRCEQGKVETKNTFSSNLGG